MKKNLLICLAVLLTTNLFAQNNFYELPYLPNTGGGNVYKGVDNNGRVFARSDSAYVFENNNWNRFPVFDTISLWEGLVFDDHNTGYFFHYNEFYRLSAGTNPVKITSNFTLQYPQLNIRDYYFDKNNKLWMCGSYYLDSMAIVLEYDSLSGFNAHTYALSSVSYNIPLQVRSDGNGTTYLRTSGDSLSPSAIYFLNGNTISLVDSSNFGLFMSTNNTSIDLDPSGKFYIIGVQDPTYYPALITYNGTSSILFVDSSFSGSTYSMHIADNGDVWLFDAIYSTLCKINGANLVSYYYTGIFFGYPHFLICKNGLIYIWDEMSLYPPLIFNEYGFNYLAGSVYYDINGDGSRQAGEYSVTNQKVSVQPNNVFDFSDVSGYQITLMDTAGTYAVSCAVPANWHISTLPTTYAVTQTYPTQHTNNLDFGLSPNSVFTDLSITMSVSRLRPGFSGWGYLEIENKGATVSNNDTVRLLLPSGVTIGSANPNYLSLNADTVTWVLDSVLPLQSMVLSFNLQVAVSVPVGIGLLFIATTGPATGDVNALDNTTSLRRITTASFDPNEKTIDYPNPNVGGFIDPWQELLYTVYFQNTGSDTAFNINVRDTLSPYLDVNTLRMVASSAPYSYSLNDGMLRFDFNNIMLPDSNTNELLSHGFVSYAIKPINLVSSGTVVTNTAYIYFDFNTPVITNTTSNTILITAVESLTGNKDIKVYPNPSSALITIEWKRNDDAPSLIELIDLTGRVVKSEMLPPAAVPGKRNFDLSVFQNGVYLLRVLSNDEQAVFKVVKE